MCFEPSSYNLCTKSILFQTVFNHLEKIFLATTACVFFQMEFKKSSPVLLPWVISRYHNMYFTTHNLGFLNVSNIIRGCMKTWPSCLNFSENTKIHLDSEHLTSPTLKPLNQVLEPILFLNKNLLSQRYVLLMKKTLHY